jgi:prepilin-type N-terminal cleavage/methylation domain-containing protein
MRTRHASPTGFTIVELLIVIVIIGILAAIVIVAYNGITTRAAGAKRDSDMDQYYRAIIIARQSTGKTLAQITGSYWSAGFCTYSGTNPSGTEPKDLPKTHVCWTQYYDNLNKIGAAAGMSLASLMAGDSRGNPYVLDENEGEGGDCTRQDGMYFFTGSGISLQWEHSMPPSGNC